MSNGRRFKKRRPTVLREFRPEHPTELDPDPLVHSLTKVEYDEMQKPHENGVAPTGLEEVTLPDPDYDPTLDELAQANQERVNRLAMWGVPVPTDLWWVTYMLEYLIGIDDIDRVRLAYNYELAAKLERAEQDVSRARIANAGRVPGA